MWPQDFQECPPSFLIARARMGVTLLGSIKILKQRQRQRSPCLDCSRVCKLFCASY